MHDVTLFLLAKRERLRQIPGRAYFLRAVRHAALRHRLYAWSRYTVVMDPGDLLLAEQAMVAAHLGRPSVRPVRLTAEECDRQPRDAMGGSSPEVVARR